MSFIAAAVATTALSGGLQAGASIYGAGQQADAARYAADLQSGAGQRARGDQMPYMQAGNIALADLQRLGGTGGQPVNMDALTSNPAYQFQLQQGLDAVNKGAASRGAYYQPKTLQDIARFSQGLASQEFGNIWNRDAQIAGLGQSAAAGAGNFGVGAANAAAGGITGAANANAAGLVGATNAFTGSLGQGYNAYLTQQILGRSQQPLQQFGGGQQAIPLNQFGDLSGNLS